MALSSAGIATGIAALSISGVNVKDLSAIPQAVNARDCPIFYPNPEQWKSGGTSEPGDGAATFGTPSTRMWLFNRSYQYVYLHEAIGAERTIAINYTAMSAKEDLILTALVGLDIADVDVKNVSTSGYGIQPDPAGNNFYGFIVNIVLREKVNP